MPTGVELARVLTTPYDASYPPSILTPPSPAVPTGVTPGAPGAFTPPGSGIPANLAALNLLGSFGQTDPWAADQYVTLGDGSFATWDGGAWVVFVPARQAIDPATATVAEVQAWVNAEYPDLDNLTPEQVAVVQGILDAERAGQNRATLVSWLDQIEGVE